MKKLILVALAFVSMQAVAQQKEKKQLKESKKAKMSMRHDMSAEDMATIATKKMTLALDLNEKQQSQIKEIMLEEASHRKQKMAKREEMKKELEVKKEKAKADNVKEINDRLDRKIEVKKKMKSILTSEQYQKWEKMQGGIRHHKAKKKDKMKSRH